MISEEDIIDAIESYNRANNAPASIRDVAIILALKGKVGTEEIREKIKNVSEWFSEFTKTDEFREIIEKITELAGRGEVSMALGGYLTQKTLSEALASE